MWLRTSTKYGEVEGLVQKAFILRCWYQLIVFILVMTYETHGSSTFYVTNLRLCWVKERKRNWERGARILHRLSNALMQRSQVMLTADPPFSGSQHYVYSWPCSSPLWMGVRIQNGQWPSLAVQSDYGYRVSGYRQLSWCIPSPCFTGAWSTNLVVSFLSRPESLHVPPPFCSFEGFPEVAW